VCRLRESEVSRESRRHTLPHCAGGLLFRQHLREPKVAHCRTASGRRRNTCLSVYGRACPGGYYNDEQGQLNCTACALVSEWLSRVARAVIYPSLSPPRRVCKGYESTKSKASITCTICSPGTYASKKGTATCKDVPKGPDGLPGRGAAWKR
jgi:hypothetical protein